MDSLPPSTILHFHHNSPRQKKEGGVAPPICPSSCKFSCLSAAGDSIFGIPGPSPILPPPLSQDFCNSPEAIPRPWPLVFPCFLQSAPCPSPRRGLGFSSPFFSQYLNFSRSAFHLLTLWPFSPLPDTQYPSMGCLLLLLASGPFSPPLPSCFFLPWPSCPNKAVELISKSSRRGKLQ